MMQPVIGNIYDYNKSDRPPQRLKVVDIKGKYAICDVKAPDDKAWRGQTQIRTDRFNPSNHIKLFRKAR